MLKGKKLKHPDRLGVGSLVAGFEDKDDDSQGSGSALDLGEELKIIQPNGFRSGRETGIKMVKFKKRHWSDIEYEISQKVINVGKLQRIVSTGLPDGGNLSPTHLLGEESELARIKEEALHSNEQNKADSEQIDRDLQRTHPEMKFFSGESSFSRRHRCNAEADSFACFVRLLSDSVDHFSEQLDNSSVGILSTLSHLAELLKANDEELWRHLEFTTKESLMEVKPQYYAFRWITLLLTQEFNLKSNLRIWDSLLSNPFGFQEMLLRVCCAMLLCTKSRFLSGDFAANLRLLQQYPDINIEYLLKVAQDPSPDTSSYSLCKFIPYPLLHKAYLLTCFTKLQY
ncbi:Ypt/Rab-GAP domain of gyp1p superfamily protein isoform 2 [Hibiscus syriacus]|uniref:Ypt/Rab-GAP domain of gyp1p superfamily protein isoform 2 n=1 Tax=Hibiscus syriacus TaxID=106335 RepID=A0A6A2Z9R3_HIBSY|nr:Ypt/Rab-GAP domain of gyp1p superfamily protein isoform 2 [Hibiscus syriacus]